MPLQNIYLFIYNFAHILLNIDKINTSGYVAGYPREKKITLMLDLQNKVQDTIYIIIIMNQFVHSAHTYWYWTSLQHYNNTIKYNLLMSLDVNVLQIITK